MKSQVAIRLDRVSHRFARQLALQEVGFEVPVGAFFALLGSNGAGKSTTVRLLSTLLEPQTGTIEVAGLDARNNPHAIRRQIGVVPDFPVLFDPLTIEENLSRLGALRGIPRSDVQERIRELARALELESQVQIAVDRLSHGTRKKAALAAAMLHAPQVLLLDEPFEGIDPIASATIRRILDMLRARGVTVFLTSHVLTLVESVASDAAILDRGSLKTCRPLPELLDDHGSLDAAFRELVGAGSEVPALEWYAP